MTLESIIHLLALAASLEDEGRINNAKLLSAVVESLLRREAHRQPIPTDRATLLAETDKAIAWLAGMGFDRDIMLALERSRQALGEGRLPHFEATPDPYMCRVCGHLSLANTTVCPECGAQSETFKRFRPVFWLEAFDPFQSLEHLRATPGRVAAMIQSAPGALAEQLPEAGGWSLRQAVSHLRDAQGVLDFRVKLILEQDNPRLESKAVFEWATDQTGQPASLEEIFETYRASRQQTVQRLEGLPLAEWRRTGRHEEFGLLKLSEQVSYFACHEITHFPQMMSLAGG